MTTYASFKPSVQFLEAGEKGQQFANAANTFKPFLPQEARQSIEGIDKVSQAFTATSRALEHFGFDEAEPDVTTSEVELISTDDLQIVDNMSASFLGSVPESLRPSAFVIESGRALQQNGWEVTGEGIATAGHLMRAFGYDEADPDSITANSAANDPLTGGGQMMDTDDDLGAWFALPAVTGLFKGSLFAGATKVMGAAKGVIAGAKAVTAKQVGSALVTGGVSGVASYGAMSATERFSELLSEADDRDSDYGTPWVPEVAVDPIA